MGRGARSSLRERSGEVAELDRALHAARGGHGRFVAIEGEAGIGKTSLLGVAGEHAERAGMRVLSARGSELEHEFAFSVVRQLFEPLLYAAEAEERERWSAGAASLAMALFEEHPVATREPDPEQEVRFRRRHGLYWLVANIARDAPLAIVVDDAHWADEPSLGFLRHLVTRLGGLPVLLLIASRPGAATTLPLLADSAAHVLRPAPLSAGAVADWVSDYLEQRADEEFAAACHRATAGIPFLVGELLREVRAERVSPDATGVERLRGLSPRAITTSVLLRLAALPAGASALARAAAVAGEAGLPAVATLAGLDIGTAAAAAAALVRAGLLAGSEPVAFAHPVVRTVLYEDIPQPERALAHARAARTLREHGASEDHVAAQLALAAPIGEAWALDTLRSAAKAAIWHGAPEVGAHLLARALAETADPDERFELTLALGRAEVLAGRPEAMGRLRAGLALARTPEQHLRAAVLLGRVLRYAGGGAEAVELLECAERRIGPEDTDLASLIEQELLATSTVSYEGRRRLAGRTESWWARAERPPVGFFDRFVHAARAVDAACRGAPLSHVVELAEASLGARTAGDHLGRHVGLLAGYAFLLAERFDRVEALLGALGDAAAAVGGAHTRAVIVAQRALLSSYRGHVTAAESDALDALTSVADVEAPPAYLLTAAATLLWVAAERGEAPHPAAASIRDDGDSLFGRHLNYARGLLDVAEGRFGRGAARLLEVGERERGLGWRGASQFTWRSQAALALAAEGDYARARQLADEEVELARAAGARRALGIALRGSALLGEGDARSRLLEEAVAVLERSGADLEHARALVDLGSTLRRGRAAARAREPLRRGYDLALRCGATRLAERAREELLATGARPRRVSLSGRDALTPSELRVVELAARGMTNREIAQALFVTEKTVETHLLHAYPKLGVGSRRELVKALERGSDEAAQAAA